MSRKEGLQRHRFIIRQLEKKPSTFKEILDYLEFQEGITPENKFTCSIRTFQRDIRDIATIYDIEIKCDKARNEYYISHDGREDYSERLMESLDLFNAIKMGNSLGNIMLFENRQALGVEHMNGLLHAIKNRLEVSFNYKKFYDASVTKRTVRPVAIKEARNRWYLLAQDTKDEIIKNFGLDRLFDMEIGRQNFKAIKDYDPAKEFKHHFGIINGTGEEPQRVVLSFTPTEGRYVKSLPLHHSQHEILNNEKERQFEYFLVPTYDFRMEILSYGNTVKVLEPEGLRQQIIDQLQEALGKYEVE